MAYLEVAPYNRVSPKKHENIAGCLIAFAFKQSLIRGVGHHQGILNFWVGEERKEDEEKLIDLYKTKYNAVQIGNSPVLEIADETGEELIRKYLG